MDRSEFLTRKRLVEQLAITMRKECNAWAKKYEARSRKTEEKPSKSIRSVAEYYEKQEKDYAAWVKQEDSAFAAKIRNFLVCIETIKS